MISMAELPADLTFRQEWQRIVFKPNGERLERFDSDWHGDENNVLSISGWYHDENIVRSMLNPEYPEPTSTGWYMRIQTRWTSEHRMINDSPAPDGEGS